jgi:molybdopterin-containing oxidoreductase family membrane subunit
MAGDYGPLYWSGLLLAVVPPQLLWFRPWRLSPWAAGAVGMLVLVGTYCAYLSIVVGGLQLDHLALAAPTYVPTFAEVSLLLGTLGLFVAMLLGSIRLLPVVSVYETRQDARPGT